MTVGLALCKFEGEKKKYLFQQPRYAYIEKGEKVIVDTVRGQQEAEVVSACTAITGSDEFDMIVKATGATMPLKRVVARIRTDTLEYEKDELELGAKDGDDDKQV